MRQSLLALCALAFACTDTSAGPRKLVILHTNDEHSHLLGAGPEQDDLPPPVTAGTGSIKGGIARRSAVLKSERDAAKAAGAAHLTVSAGDNMMGTLTQVAALSASPDYRLMKMLGYDVTTLGNHEFDYGPGALAAIITTAKNSNEGLPAIVASNIVFGGPTAAGDDSALQALFDELGTNTSAPIHRKLVVTTSNGLRVGFVGIMGADAAAVAPLKAPTHFSLAYNQSESNRLAALSQIFDDIQPVVDQLHRDMGAQVVVALSHGGLYPNSLASSEDYLIARNVSGIDVIVSGHSHTEASATVTNLRSGKKVFVQQAGRFGDNVGRISLTVEGSGNVSVDPAASQLIKVDDTTVASDANVNAFVAKVVSGLETPTPSSSLSFLQFTLLEALGPPPPLPNPDIPGALYSYSVGGLDFDVDNSGKVMETSLLDLSADAQLAAVSALKLPGGVDAALEASGVLRVSKIERAKSGKLGFGDVFRAVPLGATPATIGPSAGTPGYPLCRVAIYLAEMKAVFETTAGFAYAGHDDFYVVPAGFKFEYDTSRAPFNPNGDALDKNNGRVTKIYKLSSADLAAGNFDGNYDLVFDASTSNGWVPTSAAPAGPLTLVRVAASLYMATFAATAGVHLKDAVTGLPISGATPTAIASSTILHRTSPGDLACDGQGRCTEIKVWEALAAYVKAQSTATGKLPSRYDKSVATLPRRAVCVGVNSSNPSGGNCSY
jgi:5'-nucleotidase